MRVALIDLRRLVALAAALFAGAAAFGCGSEQVGSADASAIDAEPPPFDLCDAFTGVGTSCPRAGPTECFPLCDGGCSCTATPDGPRWACVTDRSCQPACAPIDDACAPLPTADDGGSE